MRISRYQAVVGLLLGAFGVVGLQVREYDIATMQAVRESGADTNGNSHLERIEAVRHIRDSFFEDGVLSDNGYRKALEYGKSQFKDSSDLGNFIEALELIRISQNSKK